MRRCEFKISNQYFGITFKRFLLKIIWCVRWKIINTWGNSQVLKILVPYTQIEPKKKKKKSVLFLSLQMKVIWNMTTCAPCLPMWPIKPTLSSWKALLLGFWVWVDQSWTTWTRSPVKNNSGLGLSPETLQPEYLFVCFSRAFIVLPNTSIAFFCL